MTVRVRPFAERDYAALARIRSTGEQDPTTPERLRTADASWDGARYAKVRVVAVDEEDAPLGYGEIYHEPTRFDPRRYFLRLAVDLRMRRRGLGAAIWSSLGDELAARDALAVYAWARDATAGASFLARRGFEEVVRRYSQVRAVATAPLPTGLDDERLATAGLRITSLDVLLREDPAALEKTYELYYASRSGEPVRWPDLTRIPFETWRAKSVDDEQSLRDAYLIAIEGDRYVGQTTGRRANADDVLDIGITGVLPSHRRRGLARALKLQLHKYARRNGYREIHTTTLRENPAMAALNDSLGYAIVESIAGYELTSPIRTSP